MDRRVPAHAVKLPRDFFPDGRAADPNHEGRVRIICVIRDLAEHGDTCNFGRKQRVVIQKAEQRIAAAADNIRRDLSMAAGSNYNDLFTHAPKPPLP